MHCKYPRNIILFRLACTHSSPLGLRATLKPRAGSFNFVRDPSGLPLFFGGSIGGAAITGAVCEASHAVQEPSFVWAANLEIAGSIFKTVTTKYGLLAAHSGY
jgi:hypothetical protein